MLLTICKTHHSVNAISRARTQEQPSPQKKENTNGDVFIHYLVDSASEDKYNVFLLVR